MKEKSKANSSLIRYEDHLGCKGANLTADADSFYARYTTSSLCNGLIQSSKDDCNLSDDEARPLCADSCVRFPIPFRQLISILTW